MPAKKKSSKKPLARVMWSSRKTQAIAVVLVFAIIGGGILIYKSFADALAIGSYSISNYGLSGAPSKCASATAYSDGSGKAANQVFRASLGSGCAYSRSAEVYASGVRGGPYATGQYLNSWFRGCAYVKGGTANAPIYVQLTKTGASDATTIPYTVISTSSYGYYCSGWIYISGSESVDVSVTLRSSNPASAVIYVSSVDLENSTTNPSAGQNPGPPATK